VKNNFFIIKTSQLKTGYFSMEIFILAQRKAVNKKQVVFRFNIERRFGEDSTQFENA